jgi:glycosyltransferase involved in cell wall biosynthesis/SAM-dependent methyltransferase
VGTPRLSVDIAAEPASGVNLVGYLGAELGIGEVARRIGLGLESAGIAFSTIEYERTHSRRQHHYAARRPGEAPFDTNVICINADQLPVFREDVGEDFFADRYSVGVWFWEVASFPAVYHSSFDLVDEVWVATTFVREALSSATSKPVVVIPLPLEAPAAPALTRQELGMPDGFVFLFSFDFLSVFERKNPIAVIDAFKKAFTEGEGARLVVKTINGELDPANAGKLRDACRSRSDIYLRDGYVSPEEKNGLMANCDCYVSLHRSEGLGLTIAEAMAYSRPVIATAYSGNLDFMNESNSYLVPYTLAAIPTGCDPYPEDAFWADPDLDVAAAIMRRVFDHQDAARAQGARAREHVLTRFSIERTAAFISGRLSSLHRPETRAQRVTTAGKAHKGSPLDAARNELALGPGGQLVRAKAGRPGVKTLRRAARSILWPYLLGQHRLSVNLVKAVKAVEQAVNVVQNSESRLEAELTAGPYVSDPDAVFTHDDAGNRVLGYDCEVETGSVYRRFEDVFRGSEAMITERLRPYLEVVGDRSPVLDVGCGRGEFLELLQETGIDARGIDLDSEMVAHCRGKNLLVEQADAISYLEAEPDRSLGVIFSAQVIEHLPYEELLRFFELARAKLRTDGIFVAETVNPHSIEAFRTFWTDLTHRAPIFPEVALTLARLHGFPSARIVFPLGSGDLERDCRTFGQYALVAAMASGRPRPLVSQT